MNKLVRESFGLKKQVRKKTSDSFLRSQFPKRVNSILAVFDEFMLNLDLNNENFTGAGLKPITS